MYITYSPLEFRFIIVSVFNVPCFFFFKKKTAYEISVCLGFRRVLFRSCLRIAFGSPAEPNAIRRQRTNCIVVPSAYPSTESEERRVGKEGRARTAWRA